MAQRRASPATSFTENRGARTRACRVPTPGDAAALRAAGRASLACLHDSPAAGHRVLPTGEELGAGGFIHGRLESPFSPPKTLDLSHAFPETGSQTGQICSA